MNKICIKWFNRPIIFRYCFFTLFIVSISINQLLFMNHSNFFILYIFCAMFLGIGFYNKSFLLLFLFTFLIVLTRFLSIPDSDPTIISFFVYLITYLLITYLSAALMKYSQKIKEDNIELTKALANALDSRDTYTLNHSENVSKIAVHIAEKMNLSKGFIEAMQIGGLLHDIGKIGIPEQILTKPGKLNDEEYQIIQSHSVVGFDITKHISSFKEKGILDMILYHHERYDGKGYPEGLIGEQIPLGARIIAIADTFDAMRNRRIYREELDLKYILKEIKLQKGKQFDPQIVNIFLDVVDKIK